MRLENVEDLDFTASENVVEDLIVPEIPNVIPNEQLYVYIPDELLTKEYFVKLLQAELAKKVDFTSQPFCVYTTDNQGRQTTRKIVNKLDDAVAGAIPSYRITSVNWNSIPSVSLWTDTPRYPGQCANKQFVEDTVSEAMTSSSTKLYRHNIGLYGTEQREGSDRRLVEYYVIFTYISKDAFSYTLDDIMDRFENKEITARVMYYNDEYHSNYFYGVCSVNFNADSNGYLAYIDGVGNDDDLTVLACAEHIYFESFSTEYGDASIVDLTLDDVVEEL